jgi:hypothetical protein
MIHVCRGNLYVLLNFMMEENFAVEKDRFGNIDSATFNNTEVLRLSARDLGALALPDRCPRCQWLRFRCQHRLPFQTFAGITMVLDSYTKRIVTEHYEQYHRLPHWFSPFGDLETPVPVPHHSKFFILDQETHIRLSGVPDALFKCKDNTYCIIDYKTARWSQAQEDILPMYRVQLNGYAYIAEHVGFHPVSKVGLLYFEAQTLSERMEDFESLVMKDGFHVQFCARYLEVELDPHRIIPPLLKQARQLADMAEPPESQNDCKDCQRVDELIGWLSQPKKVYQKIDKAQKPIR